jgi:hypothetical protein
MNARMKEYWDMYVPMNCPGVIPFFREQEQDPGNSTWSFEALLLAESRNCTDALLAAPGYTAIGVRIALWVEEVPLRTRGTSSYRTLLKISSWCCFPLLLQDAMKIEQETILIISIHLFSCVIYFTASL